MTSKEGPSLQSSSKCKEDLSESPSLQSSSKLKEDNELYFITSWPPCDENPIIQGDDPAGSYSKVFYHDQKQCGSEDNLINNAAASVMRLENKTAYEIESVPAIKKFKRSSTAWEDEDINMQYAISILATWWKKQGQKSVKGKFSSTSSNPWTVLYSVLRTKEAKCFLKEKVVELKNGLARCSPVARTSCYVALASCYEALEEYNTAEELLKKAVISSSHKHNDILWLLAKVRRQLNIKHQQQVLARQLKAEQNLKLRKPRYVERRSAADLTVEEFHQKYARTRTPVVIRDVVNKMIQEEWNLNFICKVAGKKRVTLRKLVPNSIEWARLEADLDMTVEEFIDSVVNMESEKRYLFDWSLPLHCPELADQLIVPDYFREDFLKQTTPGSLYRDSWPSLFVAPAGITSELHVDAFGSNFWMALFVGQKRWTFFQEEDTAKLYPRYFHSLDPVFDVDLSDPRLDKFPLLSLAQPMECILQPGLLTYRTHP
ncbi:uncharacterized protein LOC106468862 isoform X1 [Limulus polyphemus]|uniref:Uncharacterized protein LOC106468862 isoform X1 n=1 Tax=Limulus polyphemus TaxID=6850 RepID=A0ABM1BM38_LIMPO|nr:uncharacterized protein LOC106468862 isoform X1 [Limulus polyphemus]XP_022252929.1 uncharacterized protein LOC106468862 isoform X1 [Limulus polyphemus]XP_022252930.1 uncharacterized protein LOC106468862 isoform X1 [Limulus polyphemus]XP_022252931.1 uncharacterized protein LOC106468862 isoform X1 [Limulus polyphemus]